MRDFDLRAPRDDDWPAVVDLANRSIADVPGAGAQDEWAANRRTFDQHAGAQQHWVALDPATTDVLGYVAVERRSGDDAARLFVVTDPALRDDVGSRLLHHAIETARRDRAHDITMIEYAADEAFIDFLRAHGFTETRRFALPEGGDACVLTLSRD